MSLFRLDDPSLSKPGVDSQELADIVRGTDLPDFDVAVPEIKDENLEYIATKSLPSTVAIEASALTGSIEISKEDAMGIKPDQPAFGYTSKSFQKMDGVIDSYLSVIFDNAFKFVDDNGAHVPHYCDVKLIPESNSTKAIFYPYSLRNRLFTEMSAFNEWIGQKGKTSVVTLCDNNPLFGVVLKCTVPEDILNATMKNGKKTKTPEFLLIAGLSTPVAIKETELSKNKAGKYVLSKSDFSYDKIKNCLDNDAAKFIEFQKVDVEFLGFTLGVSLSVENESTVEKKVKKDDKKKSLSDFIKKLFEGVSHE